MLVKKEDTLVFNMRIPRDLHDEVDEVRAAAKSINAAYDPSAILVKALRKDLAVTRKQIEAEKANRAKIKAD